MNALKALINLSRAVAIAPELTQGGGGNTSVKSESGMLIKASGFRLDEISTTNGFVNVNHLPVQAFLKKETVELKQPDADLKQFVNEQIIGDKTFLPSMETGFHAVLKNYVIHTHPVAVNCVLCCADGPETIQSIFSDESVVVLPPLLPGYYLSKAIADISEIPPVIFLQNHGLIVHADSEEEAIALHAGVIDKLNLVLDFDTNFHFELLPVSENLYELKTETLPTFFSQPSLLSSTYFPDQAVVIGNDYIFSSDKNNSKKIRFDTANKQCFIKTNYKNALAISENLVALAYIANYANEKELDLNPLAEADVAYILGMDMEKYRQSLLK